MKWHFQFTKHDEHDYDATQIPVLIDDGGRHLVAQANRNGFFYVIDRTNGKLLSATPYGRVTWSNSKDANGVPLERKEASPTLTGVPVCPGALGATNWFSPTYDPQTKLFYVTAREQCDIFSTAPQPYDPGHAFYGSAYFPNDDSQPFWGAVRAIDPATSQIKWSSSIFLHHGRVCSPLRAVWFSRETQKGTSWRWTPPQARFSGTFSVARLFTPVP